MFCVQQFAELTVWIMNTEGIPEANSTANWTATDEVPSQSSLLVVQVFLGVISVSAFLGNGLVCVAIMRNREILRSAYNTFLFSLAITDMLTGIIIHQTHYEKSDWSRAFNQFTIASELDMINAISAADNAFIMLSSTSAWLLSPLECSPQKQNG